MAVTGIWCGGCDVIYSGFKRCCPHCDTGNPRHYLVQRWLFDPDSLECAEEVTK